MPHSLPTGRVYGMHLSPHLPPIPSATKWWRWYRTLEASDLFDVFVGQLCSSLKCDKCQNISLTFDPFWELSVSLPKVRSPDSYVTYMYMYMHVLFVHFCFTFFSLLRVTQVPIPQITMEHPTLGVTLVMPLTYIFKTAWILSLRKRH